MRLAILTDTPQQGMSHTTVYGDAAPIAELDINGQMVLVCAQGQADPRATIRTLKDIGVTHLWLCESVGALSPLLEAGDWIVPHDYIDGTRGQHYTYFSEKAGGYVQQMPAFDPVSREALLAGLRAVTARPFQRGVYVCVSHTRLETPAEALFWQRAGGHIVGRYLSPCLTLAREVEMDVAVLAHVVRAGGTTGDAVALNTFAHVIAQAISQIN